MEISVPIPTFLVKAWWFLNGLSTCCGAEIHEWSWKKAYCKKCGNKQ